METSALTLRQALTPEDQARAEFYALLARLYALAADAPILAMIGASELWADDGANPLASSWNGLILASQAMDAEAADQEYTDLFVGVGRSEVDLHASHWIVEATSERPLVGVRSDLARMGLGRRPGSTLYEDHLAALCETMRILIAGTGDRPPAAPAIQRAFFETRIAPWVFDCCDAIRQSSVANYYVRVAQLTSEFLAVERDSLAID
jgi:TorA maturation chaperone TorD